MSNSAPRRKKKRKWMIPLVTAFIGAAGAIVAALASNPSATIDVITGSAPAAKATVRITPSAVPAATVTITAGPVPTDPGQITFPGCPSSQGCKAFNLVAQLGSNGANTGLDFSTGSVKLDGGGDLVYGDSQNGTRELTGYGDSAYSIGVTARQANRLGCEALTTSDPDSNPITGFHMGLTFCVATGFNEQGIALVTETQPVGSNGVLYLRELFWPSQNQ